MKVTVKGKKYKLKIRKDESVTDCDLCDLNDAEHSACYLGGEYDCIAYRGYFKEVKKKKKSKKTKAYCPKGL